LTSAGDFNGDGCGDVLIGAPADTYPYHGGFVEMFFGSPDGLPPSASWRLTEDAVGSQFGASVSWAGDFNGDGRDDVVVGAPGFDVRYRDEGTVRVLFGSPRGGAGVQWSAVGPATDARFGTAVLGAGDVDGDGFDDVVVGAAGYASGQGAVYFFRGGNAPSTASKTMFVSPVPGAALGSRLAGGGDVNGDGYNDVVVTAPGYTDAEGNEGAVYLFLGSPSGFLEAPAQVLAGSVAYAKFGSSVAMADLDGDGYSDVAVGAPDQKESGSLSVGRVLVFYSMGESGDLRPGVVLSAGSDHFGYTVAAAGDLDRDGFCDLVVGTDHAFSRTPKKIAYIFRGKNSGVGPSPAQVISRSVGGDYFSATMQVAAAGDVNGDHVADVLLSDGTYFGLSGSVWLHYGTGAGGGALGGEPAWTSSGAGLARAAATAGDVDGDGWDELIVGNARDASGGTDAGAARLYRGRDGGWSDCTWAATGRQGGDAYGHSVAGVGDVNGDGFADIAVGAPHATVSVEDEGAVYCYFGSPTGPGTQPDFVARGGQRGSQMGFDVAGAGDVNGDGYGDIIVGALLYTAPEVHEGRVFVYYGNPYGLSDSLRWVGEIDQSEAWFGYAVATAGDVNGDGYSDVLVGAPYYDGSALDEGAVFAYFGGPDGLSASRLQRLEVGRADAGFGMSVACAGDVNGDFFGDVIIGAGGTAFTRLGRGAAFVFDGRLFGIESRPSWSRLEARDGFVVKGVGDVDGDGYSDVAVGDPLFDGAGQEAGRVAVFGGGSAGVSGIPRWSVQGSLAGEQLGAALVAPGDANGDGWSDVAALARGDSATVALYTTRSAECRSVLRQQVRPGVPGNVSILGYTGHENLLLLRVTVRPPAGAASVWVECEAQSFSEAWDDGAPPSTRLVRRLLPSERTAGSRVVMDILVPVDAADRVLKWRARVGADSPVYAGARWYSPPNNTAGSAVVRNGPWPDVPPPPEPPPSPDPRYAFTVQAPYPNPFNPSVTVRFTLDEPGRVEVSVYDVRGAKVRTLLLETLGRGPHEARWEGDDDRGMRVGSGVYFVRVESDGRVASRKLVLVR